MPSSFLRKSSSSLTEIKIQTVCESENLSPVADQQPRLVLPVKINYAFQKNFIRSMTQFCLRSENYFKVVEVLQSCGIDPKKLLTFKDLEQALLHWESSSKSISFRCSKPSLMKSFLKALVVVLNGYARQDYGCCEAHRIIELNNF